LTFAFLDDGSPSTAPESTFDCLQSSVDFKRYIVIKVLS
jgi:hypothetical protein